ASRQPAKTPRPTPAAASGGLEAEYSALLAEVLGVAEVSATSNFYDDLGADSLLMARFCARVRSRPDLPNVTIRDVYRAPTIAALAAAGVGRPAVVEDRGQVPAAATATVAPSTPPVRCDVVAAPVRAAGASSPVVD